MTYIMSLYFQFQFFGLYNLGCPGTCTGDFFEEWNEITPQTHIRKFEDGVHPRL